MPDPIAQISRRPQLNKLFGENSGVIKVSENKYKLPKPGQLFGGLNVQPTYAPYDFILHFAGDQTLADVTIQSENSKSSPISLKALSERLQSDFPFADLHLKYAEIKITNKGTYLGFDSPSATGGRFNFAMRDASAYLEGSGNIARLSPELNFFRLMPDGSGGPNVRVYQLLGVPGIQEGFDSVYELYDGKAGINALIKVVQGATDESQAGRTYVKTDYSLPVDRLKEILKLPKTERFAALGRQIKSITFAFPNGSEVKLPVVSSSETQPSVGLNLIPEKVIERFPGLRQARLDVERSGENLLIRPFTTHGHLSSERLVVNSQVLGELPKILAAQNDALRMKELASLLSEDLERNMRLKRVQLKHTANLFGPGGMPPYTEEIRGRYLEEGHRLPKTPATATARNTVSNPNLQLARIRMSAAPDSSRLIDNALKHSLGRNALDVSESSAVVESLSTIQKGARRAALQQGARKVVGSTGLGVQLWRMYSASRAGNSGQAWKIFGAEISPALASMAGMSATELTVLGTGTGVSVGRAAAGVAAGLTAATTFTAFVTSLIVALPATVVTLLAEHFVIDPAWRDSYSGVTRLAASTGRWKSSKLPSASAELADFVRFDSTMLNSKKFGPENICTAGKILDYLEQGLTRLESDQVKLGQLRRLVAQSPNWGTTMNEFLWRKNGGARTAEREVWLATYMTDLLKIVGAGI